FLDVNGLKLHHLDWGNPSAPALVMVHGLTGSGHAFDGSGRRFSGRYHVIATDVRGRGESAWSPDGGYTQQDYVSDLEGVVDALGLSKFTLCGTSMGGRIAMEYAGRHSERLERLIINDIGPDAEAGSDRITRNQANVPESFASIAEAVAFRAGTSSVFANLPAAEQEERMGFELRARDDGRFYWKHDPEFQRQRVSKGTPTYGYLWDVLKNLNVPTLLVWGTASDVLSEGQAQRVIETLAKGELVSVTGVGHAPTLNEPEAVSGLERFLTPIPATTT
ncbi:MAG: alpha/beta fold hydrolase, partial [Chloroflexota bacterium]